MQFETNFGVVALQFLEEDRQKENAPPVAAITPSGWIVVGSGPSSGMEGITHTSPSSAGSKNSKGIRASFSMSHLNSFAANQPVVSGKNVIIFFLLKTSYGILQILNFDWLMRYGI